jgi:dephospho-CoA kinase
MLVVGLTGSIGMGKSTAAQRFRECGFAVFDADAEVHKLYGGPLAADIEAAFPGTTTKAGVDRSKLSALLLADPDLFKQLERIVHPRLRSGQRTFLHQEHRRGATLAVLEIPLLFESGAEKMIDVTVVVSTAEQVQRTRVLARSGMTPEKLDRLLSRQMPDREKRAKAHFVVDTGGSLDDCNAQVDAIISQIEALSAHAYTQFWA